MPKQAITEHTAMYIFRNLEVACLPASTLQYSLLHPELVRLNLRFIRSSALICCCCCCCWFSFLIPTYRSHKILDSRAQGNGYQIHYITLCAANCICRLWKKYRAVRIHVLYRINSRAAYIVVSMMTGYPTSLILLGDTVPHTCYRL